jgi:hypothetical protein
MIDYIPKEGKILKKEKNIRAKRGGGFWKSIISGLTGGKSSKKDPLRMTQGGQSRMANKDGKNLNIGELN